MCPLQLSRRRSSKAESGVNTRASIIVVTPEMIDQSPDCDDASILNDKTPIPAAKSDPQEDDAQLADFPWVEGPVRMDYGYNVKSVHALLLLGGAILIGC
jgi:hypothetical protein